MPGVAFPPVGPLGLSSPPSPVLCSAKTATLSVSRRFTCRSRPDTLPASVRSWSPPRARGLVEAPRPRQGLWSPGPHSGNVTRRQVALPSSRVTPVKTCPALRPRWCPDHSPSRLQDCCLPAGKNRRLSPLYSLEGYPCVHNGFDHSVGHLRTCAVDFEAQAADRQNPKSPQTWSVVSDQKIAPQPWCRQGASGRSCELWSGRPASVADQALEAGGCAAIDTRLGRL